MANEKAAPSTRWGYIDLLETLGIFFVLAYHSTTYEFSWMKDHSLLLHLRYFSRTILSTCVPLFFFTNGFLMLNRNFSLKKHILKTVRIIVLTIVWGVITLLLLMPIKQEYLSVKEFLLGLWRLKDDWINHLWYLEVLVGIYIYFPLLKTTFDHCKPAFVFFTVVCTVMTFGNRLFDHGISIAANMAGLSNGMIEGSWFRMFNPFYGTRAYAIAYFCIGGLAYDAIERIMSISKSKRNAVAAVILLISCIALYATGVMLSRISGKLWDVVFSGYDTVFTLFNVCMLFLLSLSYNGHIKLIEVISKNTLGIYLIHMILVYLTKGFVKTIPGAQTCLGSYIYAIAILLCSLGLTQVMLKIPGLKKLVSLK